MNKAVLLVLCLAVSISSCRQYHYSQVRPVKAELPAGEILPLIPNINKAAQSASFKIPFHKKTFYKIFSEPDSLFKDFVKNIFCQPDSTRYGYCTYKVRAYNRKNIGFGYTLTNALLLFSPAMIGVPIGGYSYSLEIEVQVHDATKNLVASYVSSAPMADTKVYSGIYPNYDDQQALLKSYMKAWKICLENIAVQMRSNAAEINAKLLRSGEVPYAEVADILLHNPED